MMNICAGIVTYNPDIEELLSLIASIKKECTFLTLVDNSSSNRETIIFRIKEHPEVHLISNDKNMGIATGINQVIDYAKRNDADFIIPFDQDSKPEEGMITKLFHDFNKANSQQKDIAAIGPQHSDKQTNRKAPFIRFGFPTNKRIFSNKNNITECDFLISSGCLIPIKIIEEVGQMRDSLFIDNVDLDWCFRAKHKGYRLLGSFNAKMIHSIGENSYLIPFANISIRMHSPIRIYYMTRNRLDLYSKPYTPTLWILQDMPRFILKSLYLAIFSSERVNYVKMIWKGISLNYYK